MYLPVEIHKDSDSDYAVTVIRAGLGSGAAATPDTCFEIFADTLGSFFSRHVVLWYIASCRASGVNKKRAAEAAGTLVRFAEVLNGPVLLMGHGVMNRLIARELISSGWKEHRGQGKGYWTVGVYRFE